MVNISVITVCFNAEKEILETLQSVFAQDYSRFEYIVIDGKSTDNTVNTIISKAKECGKTDRLVLVSEKDKGIYDAMNKGIRKATGNWIIFMNAGDSFYNDTVLTYMSTFLNGTTADVVYADANYIEGENQYIVKGKQIKSISKRMPFCHQTAYNRRETILKYMFNTDFKICADYELYARMYREGALFQHVDTIACNYIIGGASYQSPNKIVLESLKIRQTYFGLHHIVFLYHVKMLRFFCGVLAKKLLPQTILKRFKSNA